MGHSMSSDSSLDITNLGIRWELPKLLQYIRYDNPENFTLISCMDWEKMLFKVGKVRLKTPQIRLKVNLYDF